MMTKKDVKVLHRQLAVDCFDKTWDFIDYRVRTNEENIEMIHNAHTSLFHWMQIGEPINFARGEWQVSRVYNLLGMGESALLHGKRSLEICLEHSIGDFDLTFGYETVARAYKNLGDSVKQKEYYILALNSIEGIAEKDEKEYTFSEIEDLK